MWLIIVILTAFRAIRHISPSPSVRAIYVVLPWRQSILLYYQPVQFRQIECTMLKFWIWCAMMSANEFSSLLSESLEKSYRRLNISAVCNYSVNTTMNWNYNVEIPVCPLVLKRGSTWPFQRSKNYPILTGNQGHFTNCYPYFAVNQGKSSVKIPPYYYPFKDICSILYPISREVKDVFFYFIPYFTRSQGQNLERIEFCE